MSIRAKTTTPASPRRRGSVLILVVAVLVLLALLGTAFISSTRVDRASSITAASTRQLEAMVDSVSSLAVESIVDDLFQRDSTGGLQYRRPTPLGATAPQRAYTHVDSWNTDLWLAARTPVLQSGIYRWPGVSILPIPKATTLAGAAFEFESPYSSSVNVPAPYSAANRRDVGISSIVIDGKIYPAFDLDHDGLADYLAADADGDGIADSGYQYLGAVSDPQYAGITFYAAVRIIDGNSAVNATTASTPLSANADDPALGGGRNNRLFPTAIDLRLLLSRNGALKAFEFDRDTDPATLTLNDHRWGDAPIVLANPPLFDYELGATPTPPLQRSDRSVLTFGYLDNSDLLWHQLGRRIDNPGYHRSSAAAERQLRGFTFADNVALASRFVLRSAVANPSLSVADAPSVLERILSRNLYDLPSAAPIPTQPYSPDEISDWFDQNFDLSEFAFTWVAGAGAHQSRLQAVRSLRAALVGRNPVSTAAPAQPFDVVTGMFNASDVPASLAHQRGTRYRGNWDAAIEYQPGDVVTYGDTAAGIEGGTYVAVNATTGVVPVIAGTPPTTNFNWSFQPYGRATHRASVNTADFNTLWTAFWNVMVNQAEDELNASPFGDAIAGGGGVPNDGAQTYLHGRTGTEHPQRMFRSPIRDAATSASDRKFLSPAQVIMLRAALAAVNAIDLRDADDTVTARAVVLPGDTIQPTPYRVVVYGSEKQPFITEVNIHGDVVTNLGSGVNPRGYIAIELHNPHDTNLDIGGWRLAGIDRGPGAFGAGTTLQFADVIDIPAGTVIPAQGYIVLHNLGAGGNDARTVPPSMTSVGATVSVPNLDTVVYDREMVLLRPRNRTISSSGTYADGSTFNEAADPTDWVPIDAFDFTGMAEGTAGPPTANAPLWHYARGSAPTHIWHFVYPGRYNAEASPRMVGIHAAAGYDPTTGADPWDPTGPATLSLGAASGSSYDPESFPLQVNNDGFGGPNPIQPNDNLFPFGGFMRLGDLMQITYIGSYKITELGPTPPVGQFIELNSITMDAAMADDTDVLTDTNDPHENIGRFVPLVKPDPMPGTIDEYSADPDQIRYGWARDLFDFVGVSSPIDDYFPSVSPAAYYGDATTPRVPPQPVANTTAAMRNPIEQPLDESAGIDGLINVNTAPVHVLATVPFTRDPQTNYQIAQAIVDYREGVNPAGAKRHFKDLFELNKVPAFRNRGPGVLTPPTATDKTNANGDFTPHAKIGTRWNPNIDIATDGVENDYESQYLMLTAVSNMLTVRSDTFTVYVVVEGWRDARSPDATRVLQRRDAFIVDRNPVTGTIRRTPVIYPVPLD